MARKKNNYNWRVSIKKLVHELEGIRKIFLLKRKGENFLIFRGGRKIMHNFEKMEKI